MEQHWKTWRCLAAALLCAAVAAYATPPQFLGTPVPDVKLKTFAEAAAVLKQAGFVAVDGGKEPTANKLNVNRVASQEPGANMRAVKGSKVKLKIYFFQIRRY